MSFDAATALETTPELKPSKPPQFWTIINYFNLLF